MHTFWEEFYEITKHVLGSNCAAYNTYLDEITQIKCIIVSHLDSDDVYFYNMTKLIREKFENYCQIDKFNLSWLLLWRWTLKVRCNICLGNLLRT